MNTSQLSIQLESYELSRLDSNVFLKSNVIYRTKYEELKEITEAKREV